MEVKGTTLFLKALLEEGVDTLFGYPGASTIDLFDELYGQKEIELILPRHEQGLIHAADGYARSTKKTGVCVVTSGPGATNLVTGIATANYDSVPLVCFTGQVATHLIGNDAFQEVDIVGITRSICKYGVVVRDRKDLGRIIKEAFYIARTGKPGPVVVDLPRDIMAAMGSDEYPETVNIRGYKPGDSVHIGQLKRAMKLLKKAERPVILAGGGVHIGGGAALLEEFADKTGIPVVTTILGRGVIDTDHPGFVGNIGMHGSYAANLAVSRCDLLFSIGTRFNDRITGKVDGFAPDAKIVHIDIDTAAISRNIKVDIPIVADSRAALEAMLHYREEYQIEPWQAEIRQWKEVLPTHQELGSSLTPEAIFSLINSRLKQGIVVTDVGQHQMWTTQYLHMNQQIRLLTSGGLGTMGYGLPAAVGAKLGNPDQPVVCITGDGGMQMNIQELATAVGNELPLIICIFNNAYLGMVRQWQQLFYDKRYAVTCLRRRKSCAKVCTGPGKNCPPYTPDFIRLAESYGAKGIRVFELEEAKEALDQAFSEEQVPVIIEFMIEPDNLVLPMVEGGQTLEHMILKEGEE